MAYPEPIALESRESLYKQAMFFWNEYERMKEEYDKLKKHLELIAESRWRCEHCGYANRNDYAMSALKELKDD